MDLRRPDLFDVGFGSGAAAWSPSDRGFIDLSSAGEEEGRSKIEGLDGVASVIDELLRAGGEDLDYESLLAVSQSVQLSRVPP